jgi:hypothetical protein
VPTDDELLGITVDDDEGSELADGGDDDDGRGEVDARPAILPDPDVLRAIERARFDMRFDSPASHLGVTASPTATDAPDGGGGGGGGSRGFRGARSRSPGRRGGFGASAANAAAAPTLAMTDFGPTCVRLRTRGGESEPEGLLPWSPASEERPPAVARPPEERSKPRSHAVLPTQPQGRVRATLDAPVVITAPIALGERPPGALL